MTASRLPPLNALRAFEAVARHRSFRKAAAELFVTPAAVTHQIKALVDFALDNVVKKANKGRVALFGFGTFEIRKRAARKGRNPKNGEEIKIKASKTLAFKPAKAVKDALC